MEFWTVEQCCDILDSQRVPVTESERVKGRYPYYGANGVQDHVADFLFDDELVLVAEDGGNFGSTTKPIAYRVSGKCWVNNHAHVLKPHEDVNVDYLCYALMYYPVGNMVNGTTRKKLNQADLRKMKVPVRPVEAQEDIVRNIQNTETAIENRKRVLALLDELVKSRFVEMFGDPVINPHQFPKELLKDIAEIKIGPFGSMLHRDDYVEGQHALVNPSHIHGDVIVPDERLTVSEDRYQELKPYHLRKDDIVLGRRGEMGRAAVVQENGMLCGTGSLFIRMKEKVNPYFLQKIITYPTFRQYIESMSVGITMQNLNTDMVSRFEIPIYPMELQNQFAAFVREVDAAKAAARREIAALETLRGKMMQEFFGVRAGVRAEG
ncbi:MAG: restriction endonuclease subunit S [Selenomonas sp.]|uniref:restriction endonuclease subunit S n=1 Tax=Selenomonas sp. TaxID=2053611 RepID=UPI0025D5AC65|nr:restriction endonuclease subunit S [Selenomonas sp.]MCI6086561.1 restriction endonuclease subunit S [Selenomonas sp.]